MGVAFGSFDNTEVNLLKTTVELACKELGIVASDETSRTRVARAVLALAKAGPIEPERLKVFAVSRFKASLTKELL